MKKQVVLSFEEFEELEKYKKNYEENRIIVSYFSWNEKEILQNSSKKDARSLAESYELLLKQ